MEEASGLPLEKEDKHAAVELSTIRMFYCFIQDSTFFLSVKCYKKR